MCRHGPVIVQCTDCVVPFAVLEISLYNVSFLLMAVVNNLNLSFHAFAGD